jgi:hypothetical protein
MQLVGFRDISDIDFLHFLKWFETDSRLLITNHLWWTGSPSTNTSPTDRTIFDGSEHQIAFANTRGGWWLVVGSAG